MGAESRCTLRIGRQQVEGRAFLETDELVFRGERKRAIPFKEIRAVRAEEGKLYVDTDEAAYVFELGTHADAWAEKIRDPKSLLDKLGVKPGQRVCALQVDDDTFVADLAARLGARPKTRLGRDHEVIFFGVDDVEDLHRLPELKAALAPGGAIWTVREKGRKDLPESLLRSAAHDAGLVDVKVARFSATHTAEKWTPRK